MVCRGYVAFKLNERYYTWYCHGDAYPQDLGHRLHAEIKGADLDEWKRKLAAIKVVHGGVEITDADVAALEPYTCNWVGWPGKQEWYKLTRECQRSYVKTLESGYLLDVDNGDGQLPRSMRGIDYMYVLDFDADKFEVNGRTVFALDAIPDEWAWEKSADADA